MRLVVCRCYKLLSSDKKHTHTHTLMEGGLELEDDVFFKDLSKRISLLIMDDDEDSLAHCPSLNLQVYIIHMIKILKFLENLYLFICGLILKAYNSQAIHPARQASSFVNYDQQTSKRESKGTGVFIPRSSNPRRKNARQGGRFTDSGNKFQRPCDQNSRGLTPHMAYSNNNMNPSHHDHSSNLRRF